MKFIINIFLIVIATIFYINSSFASSEKWGNNSVDLVELGSSFKLEIYENKLGEKNIGLSRLSDSCESFSEEVDDTISVYINDTKV